MGARGCLVGVTVVLFCLLVGGDGVPTVDEQQGTATWWGGPNGTGNPDGACGYGVAATQVVPFMGMVAGFGRDDSYCGACYNVVCTGHPACSAKGVTITVTDLCRDATYCAAAGANTPPMFEIPGKAFGKMAEDGRADELRGAVVVPVNYTWVDCFYSPIEPEYTFPAFRVHPRATSGDFAVVVVFIEGIAVGKMVGVELKNTGEEDWHEMEHTHGATWNYTSGDRKSLLPVTAPVSIRVTISWIQATIKTRVVTADDVIPAGWQPGKIYYNPNPEV